MFSGCANNGNGVLKLIQCGQTYFKYKIYHSSITGDCESIFDSLNEAYEDLFNRLVRHADHLYEFYTFDNEYPYVFFDICFYVNLEYITEDILKRANEHHLVFCKSKKNICQFTKNLIDITIILPQFVYTNECKNLKLKPIKITKKLNI